MLIDWLSNLPMLVFLLITFANSLDSDQARQNVWPDWDPNCLTLCLKNVDFEKVSRWQKRHAKLPSIQ